VLEGGIKRDTPLEKVWPHSCPRKKDLFHPQGGREARVSKGGRGVALHGIAEIRGYHEGTNVFRRGGDPEKRALY